MNDLIYIAGKDSAVKREDLEKQLYARARKERRRMLTNKRITGKEVVILSILNIICIAGTEKKENLVSIDDVSTMFNKLEANAEMRNYNHHSSLDKAIIDIINVGNAYYIQALNGLEKLNYKIQLYKTLDTIKLHYARQPLIVTEEKYKELKENALEKDQVKKSEIVWNYPLAVLLDGSYEESGRMAKEETSNGVYTSPVRAEVEKAEKKFVADIEKGTKKEWEQDRDYLQEAIFSTYCINALFDLIAMQEELPELALLKYDMTKIKSAAFEYNLMRKFPITNLIVSFDGETVKSRADKNLIEKHKELIFPAIEPDKLKPSYNSTAELKEYYLTKTYAFDGPVSDILVKFERIEDPRDNYKLTKLGVYLD